jgi:hypothetical protein
MRQLTAVRFERAMTSGRTRPLVLACEEADANADDPTPTEFLVKLRGSVQAGGVGLTCELIAAEVARFLDLPVPEPAVVEITEEFVRSVPDVESREALRKSLGLNFGSRYLRGTLPWDARWGQVGVCGGQGRWRGRLCSYGVSH